MENENASVNFSKSVPRSKRSNRLVGITVLLTPTTNLYLLRFA